ncbi:uncharacterized protein LOC134286891 [Aedes albopictus]|uniref:Reverse transcriptase domain-containing protein n=1 Tax=Aedes albopictus TaxID=7160 RepID=A0ABM1XQK2_AEDAL
MGDGNQVAADDDRELEGAVGGVMKKTDPEKDQVKFNPTFPAAAKPVDVGRSTGIDHPGKGKPSKSDEVEYLQQMLEQYKTLYLAEKQKNQQQPSMPDICGSKGAYPKMKAVENADERPASSTPKPTGERQDDTEKLHKLMSHSATDGSGEDVQAGQRPTTDGVFGLRQGIFRRSNVPAVGNASFATGIQRPRSPNDTVPDGAPIGSVDHPAVLQMRPEPAIFPVAVGPTPQQLAARQILPRDLPSFSGNPADWPVFISQYTYTTEACGYSDGENMIRLQRCLKGAAWEATRSRLILPASVPHVIESLRMRYGRSELLIESLIERVRSTPSPKADKLDTIIEFGTKIQTLCDHITAANLLDHLGNPTLLKDLVEKLPAEYKMRWATYRKNRPLVNLQTFGEYMEEVVADACSVSSYGGSESERFAKREKGRTPDRTLLHSDAGGNSNTLAKSYSNRPIDSSNSFECAICKKIGHRVRDCTTFKALAIDERWKRVQSFGLCRTCLYNHARRSCRVTNRCGVNGCLTRHHPLLHSTPKDTTTSNVPAPLDHHFHNRHLPSLLFRIIPVVLYSGANKVATYAFLDEGSNISMIERQLAATLKVTGYRHPLCLKWTGNVTREENDSQRITIEISGTNQRAPRYIMTDVGTVDSLDLPRQSLPIEKLAERFGNLRGLPIQGYHSVTPQLLIGVDNLKLAVPLKVREGNVGGPVAVKTRLGWCVYGGHPDEGQLSVNYHVCECSDGYSLDKTLKAYFSLEEAGIQPTGAGVTAEDERALRILEQTTHYSNNRYESGLLWKYDDFEFPDSYPMAVKRFECLERRLAKDPILNENVRKQIYEYEQKGYAHRASPQELNNVDLRRVWYLPLGAVTNPRKPGKVRLIWDASAKVDGVSLNSMLLKGPDQMTLLPAVLFRFRQYPVAVSADIKEMFHQVRIRPEDRHSQRFVYRADPTAPLETYLMDVATFGSTCSPATAQFVKNTNANRFTQEYPRAVEGIIHNHYVDDYLDSFATTEEAAQVASRVKEIHQHGGFEIRNWCSNQRVVLEQLGEVKKQTVIDLTSGTDKQSERVLGIMWDTQDDEFRFSTSLPDDITHLRMLDTKPTKRQLARCVMSFFDPQGFLAPYLIFGKVLLQDTWREGIGWDEQICDGTFERWKHWLEMLDIINQVNIPRCYFSMGDLTTLDIHTFVDASEIAYSCVSYFRIANPYGPAEVAFVAAKTKVAPVKPTTIPRLELMACVLGVRLAKFVVDGHSLPVRKQFFWSDSEVAMSWINADPRKYRPFVAFRVGEILEKSNREEWRWVSSKLNPADEATKWGSGPYFDKNSIWYSGPEFLRHSELQWPPRKTYDKVTDDIRVCYAHRNLEIPEQLLDVERFSSWKRMLRVMAYVCRFVNNCRTSNTGQERKIDHLTQLELQKAEECLFRAVQWDSYADELVILTKNQRLPVQKRQPLEKTSALYKISPILDTEGVLRMDSRISAAQRIPAEMKFPVILPKRHRLTMLLLKDLHCKLLHANNEAVVNEARQRYYIAHLRTQVRRVSKECQMLLGYPLTFVLSLTVVSTTLDPCW